jgi:Putative MetA-pathway of phenol degradation
MRSRILVLALPGLLLAAAVVAQDGWSGLDEPLSTDRPDFTESTSTIPRGHFQIEGGTTLNRVEDVDITSFGELLLRIGTGERWETRISAGYARVDTPFGDFSGLEDPSVGIKVRFTDDPGELGPGQPAASLLLSTSVPAGDEELTEDEWVPEAKLALGWELTPRFSLGSNLIYLYSVNGDRQHQFGATLSGSTPITDRLGAYLEWFGFSEETRDGEATHFVNTGVSYLINNDLRVDARVGTGLNDADPDWFVGIGGGVRF